VAVTGTFVLNTTLFYFVARATWKSRGWRLALICGLFLIVEISFFASNVAKIFHGAWLPLAVGVLVSIVMITWRRGRVLVTDNRVAKEGSLPDFLEHLAASKAQIRRVPGTAVFLNPGDQTTPLALRAEVEHNHALHEKVLIVSIDTMSVPVVDKDDRFIVHRVGRGLYQATHVIVRFGYQEPTDVPGALKLARKRGLLERNLDLENASFFVSRITLNPTNAPGMRPWRKKVFLAMARNAASPIEHFELPVERTVSVGSQINF
jgi:KUP system potassium uptake protein